MKYKSLVVLLFLGMMVIFFESRPEISEEIELIAFRIKARLHFHKPTDQIALVKVPKLQSSTATIILNHFKSLSEKKLAHSIFIAQSKEIEGSQQELANLFSFLKSHNNFHLGIIGNMTDDPIYQLASASIIKQIHSAMTSRQYNKDTITAVPLLDQFGGKSYPTIATEIAIKALNPDKSKLLDEKIRQETIDFFWNSAQFENGKQDRPPKYPELKLNYFSLSKFQEIGFESVKSEDISGKILFSYFENFKKRIPGGAESNYGNTPWQEPNQSLDAMTSGVHIAKIQALALDNLLSSKNLTPIPKFISLLILVCACVAAYWVWRLSPNLAVFISLSGMTFLLLISVVLESYFGLEIPISRICVYGIIFSTSGAFNSTSAAIDAKIKSNLEIESHAAVSKVHDRFLAHFSARLLDLTSKILSICQSIKESPNVSSRHLLEELSSSAIELREYLKSINDFADLRSGALGLPKLRKFMLKPVLDRILHQVAPDSKNISVEIKFDPNAMILSDELFLEPIIFNLFSNAVKYSPAGSQINIFGEVTKGLVTKIVIRDQGPGIADEFKSRIFEKFYRIKDDRAFLVKGSGLGLYLSQFFADALNFEIKVSDAPNQGSDFSISERRS
jgi:signal transduction histidine kinase